MLAPKSMRAFPIDSFPMVQGIVTLPGSFEFLGQLPLYHCTVVASHHNAFIVNVLFLLGKDVLHEFGVERHLLQGFPKWHGYLQPLEYLQETLEVALLILL